MSCRLRWGSLQDIFYIFVIHKTGEALNESGHEVNTKATVTRLKEELAVVVK